MLAVPDETTVAHIEEIPSVVRNFPELPVNVGNAGGIVTLAQLKVLPSVVRNFPVLPDIEGTAFAQLIIVPSVVMNFPILPVNVGKATIPAPTPTAALFAQ
jgi:hypothetical protein